MDYLYIGHLSIFAVAALLCFASVPKAREITHQGTREGFIGILLTCGLWAVGYLGYFLLPTPEIKVASYIFGLVAALACVGSWLYFSAAYTGRSPRQAPYLRLIIGAFLGIVIVKITNPIHQLYFTTEWVTEPFVHLALHQGILHWVILAISYVAIGVSFFMLLERFYFAGVSARPLVALLAITALPVGFNIYGAMGSSLLPIWYEPIGVAMFAVGTLFVYFERFEAIQFTADSAEPTIFLDQNMTIRGVNQTAITMFPELEGAMGRSLHSILPKVSDAVAKQCRDPVRIEHRGSPRYFHVSTSPITSGEVVTSRVITLSDVSEREQYRHQLERQNERLDQFASIVSHDLRTPLNVANGRLDLARDTGDLEHLGPVEEAHERMLELIEDLLKLARSGLDIDETQEVELPEMVHNCWEMIESGDATLSLQEGSTMIILADEDRLRQLFENLFRNAIEHGGPDVRIEVGKLSSGRGFYVEDDGPGIPEENRAKVLEPGFSTNEDGTGFGLAIVSEIVQGHDWEISVKEGSGGGARFEISDVETVE